MLRFLEHNQITVDGLVALAKKIFGRYKKLYLLIDDS
jgi:hypothetical protein